MTVQEVMLKAISGEVHWYRAAEILGWSPRMLRRWRERYEALLPNYEISSAVWDRPSGWLIAGAQPA